MQMRLNTENAGAPARGFSIEEPEAKRTKERRVLLRERGDRDRSCAPELEPLPGLAVRRRATVRGVDRDVRRSVSSTPVTLEKRRRPCRPRAQRRRIGLRLRMSAGLGPSAAYT